MKENFITTSEANNASQEATLAVEMFLMTNYRFRRNMLKTQPMASQAPLLRLN